jgi:hypothetical protein
MTQECFLQKLLNILKWSSILCKQVSNFKGSHRGTSRFHHKSSEVKTDFWADSFGFSSFISF